MGALVFVALSVIVVLVAIVVLVSIWKEDNDPQKVEPFQIIKEKVWELKGVFKRKAYLFDSGTEYILFKVLQELFGERFYIFAQVNLGHLVEAKSTEFYTKRADRSRMEKKSVDFVLCDKNKIVPQLIIELDGYTHNWNSRKERDYFVNELMKDVGLPILRLGTKNLNREYIRGEVERALAAK